MDAGAMTKDDRPGRAAGPVPLPVRAAGRRRVWPDAAPVGSDQSDGDLVRAAFQEPALFGHLYERYFAIVFGYCQRRLDEPAAAEDACAAIFSRAFASLTTCRHPDRFRSWLFTIAHTRSPTATGPVSPWPTSTTSPTCCATRPDRPRTAPLPPRRAGLCTRPCSPCRTTSATSSSSGWPA